MLRLRSKAYGRAILLEVRRNLRDDTTSGAVYATLIRLETKGLLASRWTGGRRYFTLQAGGTRALEEAKAALDRMWNGLE